MGKIGKFKIGEETVYPATIPQAVIDPETNEPLSTTLGDLKAAVKEFAPIIYGREFLRGDLDPEAVRWIGDERYKESHPILADFRPAKVKDGEIVGYFDRTNWFRMEDGSPSGIVWTDAGQDDDTDIMLVNPKGFYYIGGGTNEMYERHLVSYIPFAYDGDIATFIEPFGMAVDFAVIKSSRQRCIVDRTTLGSRAAGIGGSQYMMDRGGWPSTSLTRFNAELYARNKNADTTGNIPYCNAFQLDLRVWFSLQIIKFGTKDIHSQNVCGGGISANDAAPNENTWGLKTGVRFKRDGDYAYYNLNSTPLMSGAGGTAYNFHQILSNYRPCLWIAEMQLVLSYVRENEIPQNVTFEYDGFHYSYVNIEGSKGISEGEMTARVRKSFTTQYSGYDNIAGQEVTDLEIEWILEQPILNGKVGDWGNLYRWVSGIDRLIDGSDGNISYLYQTDEVSKVTTDTESGEIDPHEKYSFMDRYDLVGTLAYGTGYSREMFPASLWTKVKGGGLHTGECAYLSFTGEPTTGKIIRRGVFFGGHANHTVCSPRFANALLAPTNSYTNLGVGFRVTLPQSGAKRSAEFEN